METVVELRQAVERAPAFAALQAGLALPAALLKFRNGLRISFANEGGHFMIGTREGWIDGIFGSVLLVATKKAFALPQTTRDKTRC